MNNSPSKPNKKRELFSGLIACTYIIPLSAAFAAVTGQGLYGITLSTIICALFSAKSKKGILIPDIRSIAILLCLSANLSQIGVFFAVAIGGLVFCLAKRIKPKVSLPPKTAVSLGLGLALSATILLTNIYFGIGAFGDSPKNMLEAYVHLGFHPNFTGLLTGTITLFLMITYPFKFKSLSKKVAPAFITLAIPFCLNLFLNPDKLFTNINEATMLTFENSSALSLLWFDAFKIVFGGISLGALSYITNIDESYSFGLAHILSPFTLTRVSMKNYSIISALTVVAVMLITAFFTPEIYTRLPLHSIGAMLIVYSWQRVPFKLFKTAFSKTGKIIFILIICVVFIIIGPSYGVILCLAFADRIKEAEAVI